MLMEIRDAIFLFVQNIFTIKFIWDNNVGALVEEFYIVSDLCRYWGKTK